ncbi:MAG TPA: hypothetical protein DFR83_15675 [Deltaproteobacteria bacterium]|nr:hypothetical protein [Deltaproteobacteria bacterium]
MASRATVGGLGWLLLGSATAHAAPSPTIALVVPQPGLEPIAYSALLNTLRAHGVQPVLVPLPLTPQQLITETLAAEQARPTGQPLAIIGHGYGGRALLDWPDLSTTCGVALLGTPLVHRPSPWQAELPSAADHISGISLRQARIEDTPGIWPLTRTASGYPTSWLGRVSADWLGYLATSLRTTTSLPEAPEFWVGIAPLDELAPPETIPPTLPDNVTVKRWGMLRGWRYDAHAVDLLTEPRITADLTKWILQTCS